MNQIRLLPRSRPRSRRKPDQTTHIIHTHTHTQLELASPLNWPAHTTHPPSIAACSPFIKSIQSIPQYSLLSTCYNHYYYYYKTPPHPSPSNPSSSSSSSSPLGPPLLNFYSTTRTRRLPACLLRLRLRLPAYPPLPHSTHARTRTRTQPSHAQSDQLLIQSNPAACYYNYGHLEGTAIDSRLH